MPSAAELAAQLRSIADQVEAYDPAGPPQPEPEPLPGPAPQPTPAPAPAPQTGPQVPTGLVVTIGPDLRPVLTWDSAAGVDEWDVVDQLNPVKPVLDTVTTPRSVRSALRPGSPARAYAVRARNTIGTSLWCVPVVVPTVPATGTTPTPAPPTAVRYPADITGKGWYLTLPVAGTNGWAAEVHQPTLGTYASKYCELTSARDAVVFRCWHGGVTTSGSPNPRSELRECSADGLSLAKWSTLTGRHSMNVDGQVNRLTKVRPHVVLWQVHGASDDVCTFRLEGTSLWITNGNNPHGHLVTDQFQLGQRYTLKGEVAGGRVTFTYNGVDVPYAVTTTDAASYFKAGNYLQSNPTSAPGESAQEFSEVVIFGVAVTHA